MGDLWGYLKELLETQPLLLPSFLLDTVQQTGLLCPLLPRCTTWTQALRQWGQMTLH